ncbi:hypothetical protein F511_27373 [Dorcoceras hygrometricum]|uniref:Uncharacterized protein n=1 Tax=Dorcoceras hygrometricum TaxID=472368 RepID=A0A2Z7DCK1_9LAMI|nr:hypothetical protein F511_27373 [Dorcoceras hygrometricum]
MNLSKKTKSLSNFHLCFFICILIITLHPANGMRPLGDMRRSLQVLLQASLPRGQVPTSGASPCTYIRAGGSGKCTLEEKHFAGGGVARALPSPYLTHIQKFVVAAASSRNEVS